MKSGDRLYEFTAKDGERTSFSGAFEITSTDDYMTILRRVDGQNKWPDLRNYGETRVCTTSQIGHVLLFNLDDGRFLLKVYLAVNDWAVADSKFHEHLTAERDKHVERAEIWKRLVRDWEELERKDVP